MNPIPLSAGLATHGSNMLYKTCQATCHWRIPATRQPHHLTVTCDPKEASKSSKTYTEIHPKYIPNTSYPLGSSGAGFCVETSLYWSMKAQARLTKSDDLKVICKCAYTEKVERWRSTAYTNHWPPACITTMSNQTKQFHLCICRDSAEMRLHYFISWLRPDVAPCETPSLVASAKENTLACQGSRNCTNFDGFRWISMDSGNQKLVREWFDRSPNETQEVTWRCSKAAWDVKIDLPHCRFNWRVAYKSKLSGTRDPSMSYSYGNVWIRCVFM